MTSDLEHISTPLNAIISKLETAVQSTSREVAIQQGEQWIKSLAADVEVHAAHANNLAGYTADERFRTYEDFSDFERQAEIAQRKAAKLSAVERVVDDLRADAWGKYWSRT